MQSKKYHQIHQYSVTVKSQAISHVRCLY